MKLTTVFLLFIVTIIAHGQTSEIKQLSSAICDTIKKADKPLVELNVGEITAILDPVMSETYPNWSKQLNSYREKSGQDDFLFSKYFQHILVQDCKQYRILEDKLDGYLISEQTKRRLYTNTKDFIYALEDEEDLSWFFKDQMPSARTAHNLEIIKKKISKIRRKSTLGIKLIQENGYTYRITFYNYQSDEPEFQIDVIYAGESYIDLITVKDKKQLKEETKVN